MSCSWGETDRRACHVGPAVTVWLELQPADTQRASHCGWGKVPSLVVGALGFGWQLSLAREATLRSRDKRGKGDQGSTPPSVEVNGCQSEELGSKINTPQFSGSALRAGKLSI